MENASKALIIAGAILLSVLIIGIGMLIFNSAKETMDKTISSMSEQEKQTHNTKFQKFEGTRRSGTDVKTLLNVMIQNYSTQVNSGEMGRSPGLKYQALSASEETIVEHGEEVRPDKDFNFVMSDIKITRTYTVEVKLGVNSGIVENITIIENAI